MSGNPYAPSENWNTGEPRRGGGVPLWALLVACLSSLAFGCFGGIVGGFAVGFAAGESASESFADYMSEHEPGEIAVIARALTESDGSLTLEVLVSNPGESPQSLDAIDIYHELVTPDEIVGAEPAFNGTELFEDEEDAAETYTAYTFDPIVILPGKTVVVRFLLNMPDGRRTGDVDVWTESGFFRAHVHMSDSAAPPAREPGY